MPNIFHTSRVNVIFHSPGPMPFSSAIASLLLVNCFPLPLPKTFFHVKPSGSDACKEAAPSGVKQCGTSNCGLCSIEVNHKLLDVHAAVYGAGIAHFRRVETAVSCLENVLGGWSVDMVPSILRMQ